MSEIPEVFVVFDNQGEPVLVKLTGIDATREAAWLTRAERNRGPFRSERFVRPQAGVQVPWSALADVPAVS